MASSGARVAVPRGQLAFRIFVATAGAYAAGWMYAASLSLALVRIGVERSNAVAWATLTSYAIIIAVILLAFCTRSTIKLGAGLAAGLGALILAVTVIG